MNNNNITVLSESFFKEGLSYHSSGQQEKAIFSYKEALRYNPFKFEAHANLGLLYRNQQNLDQAIFHFEKAIHIKEDDPNLLFNLAMLYQLTEKNLEAEKQLKKVLLLNNKDWQAALILGKLLYKTHRYTEGLEYFHLTVTLNPTSIEAYAHLGIIYRQRNNLAESLFFFKEAIKQDPNNPMLHGLLMEAQLYSGNLYDGFIELEWRKKRPHMKDFYEKFMVLPQWQGESFSGKKLLVHAEEGLGDTLQFIRYLPLVKMRGGSVTLACQQPLLRLLEKMSGVDAVVNVCNFQDFDLCVSLMSLPMIFGTTLNTIPKNIPYITANQQLINHWQQQLSTHSSFKVGLVWSGNNNTILNRSCSISDLRPLAMVKNVVFYSLQKGEAAKQIDKAPVGLNMIDFADHINDFADTAGIIMNLDLIISIDTSISHLAGALGKSVWIALPYDSEWRWLSDREDSVWYPTVRLFRQKKEGEWNNVFIRIAETLSKLVQKKANSSI